MKTEVNQGLKKVNMSLDRPPRNLNGALWKQRCPRHGKNLRMTSTRFNSKLACGIIMSNVHVF